MILSEIPSPTGLELTDTILSYVKPAMGAGIIDLNPDIV
jgi:hypothetical protein